MRLAKLDIWFTKNANAMIKSGDPEAKKVFEEYNQSAMTSFEKLSDAEIMAIIHCIESQGKPKPN